MKIYFRNKAARLKGYTGGDYSCKRCPFLKMSDRCPWRTLDLRRIIRYF